MTSTLQTQEIHEVERFDDFVVVGSDHGLGRNVPQRVGRTLLLPMLLMAAMAFPVGIVLSIVRAGEIASGGSAATIAGLGHLVPGFMFLGFAATFGAVSFAIARILGEFRKGGGEVQELVSDEVETLKMPRTAKAFLLVMAMSMMALVGAVILHFVVGGTILAGSELALENAEQWAIWLEGVRRFGVALYLFAISLGLATIVTVLRFQSVRVREVAGIAPPDGREA